MAATHDDDPGFWPGYVAAVSGLVQGLLIMAMALATAIFALGQLTRQSPPAGGEKPAAAAGGRTVPARPAPAAVPPVLSAAPQPDPAAAQAARAGELTARSPDPWSPPPSRARQKARRSAPGSRAMQ